MRKSGVAEKYVRVVQDLYESCRTMVRCPVGVTEEFKVEVGLHQGLALSLFLFAVVMDKLIDDVRQESPWIMMFAILTLWTIMRAGSRWRYALEKREMKVSCSKKKYTRGTQVEW